MSAAGELFGVLRVADLDLALPLSALREVVPHPEALDRLPVAAPGLRGAMRLRETVLPVLDLQELLHGSTAGAGPSGSDGPRGVVVVVADAGQLVGIVVDQVCGVTRVPQSEQLALSAHGAALLVSHIFQHGVEATPVSVLDPAAILRLPGVPTVSEREPAAAAFSSASTQSGTAQPGTSLTVFRCGEHSLALAIDDLRTTIPLPVISPSALVGGPCLGVTVHKGRELPVLDPLTLLGVGVGAGAGEGREIGAGVVVPLDSGDVVLGVTRLDRLQHRQTDHMPVPDWASRRPDLLAGLVQVDDETCLLLDGAGLRADSELRAFAHLNVDVAEAAEQRVPAGLDDAGAEAGPTCLTYRVGGLQVATPLEQIVEILPHPPSLTRTQSDDVAGLIVHREQAVTVVGLAELLGRDSDATAGCLLLLELEGKHIAFAVDGLDAIKPRVWRDPAGGHHAPPRELSRVVHDSPLIRVAESDRLVPQVDLHHVAHTLLHRGSPVHDHALSSDAA